MVPATDTTTAIAYIRVSTDKQAESGLGLEAQRASIENFARANDIQILSFHADEGVSGKASLDNRPGMMSAMADCVRLRAGALLVAKMDRLSRDTLTALTIEKSLLKSGTTIKSAAGEGTASDDPSELLLRRILQAVSSHEVALVSSRTKAAMAAKKARGERVGRPPFGFKVVDGELVPTPDAAVALQAVMMRYAGVGLKTIAAEMGWGTTKAWRITKRWEDKQSELRFRIIKAGLTPPVGS